MNKESFQGGLLMFKRSFTEATQTKDEKYNSAIDKEKNTRQESHNQSESAALSRHDTCCKSKAQIMLHDHSKSHQLKGRGRGQAQISNNVPIPGNVKSSSNSQSRKMSFGSSLTCQEDENSLTPKIRNGESASLEMQHVNFKSSPCGRTLRMNKRWQHIHSHDRKPNGLDGRKLKYERHETTKLTPHQKQKENKNPEKQTNIHVVNKPESDHPAKEKGSPSAQNTSKQTDELFSTDEKTDGQRGRVFEKIQNMYKMYNKRDTDEMPSPPTQHHQKGLEIKQSGLTEINTFSDKLPNQTEVGKTDSVEKMIDPIHSEIRQTESIELMFVNKERESVPIPSKCMAPESDTITCIDNLKSVENAFENLSISGSIQAVPDHDILILEEEIPHQDMKSQSDTTNQEESRIVHKSHTNEAFSEESQAIRASINNIQEAYDSYHSEFGTRNVHKSYINKAIIEESPAVHENINSTGIQEVSANDRSQFGTRNVHYSYLKETLSKECPAVHENIDDTGTQEASADYNSKFGTRNIHYSHLKGAFSEESPAVHESIDHIGTKENSANYYSKFGTRNVHHSHLTETFSEESPAVHENIDITQEASASYFPEFSTSPEMEVFSQSESEPEETSYANKHPESSNIQCPVFQYQPYYSSFPNYFNHPEMINKQYGAQNEHSYHKREFHPQFHSSSSTPGFNFFHPHAFAPRSGPPPLIMPSDRFGSRESIELAMRYVVSQRKRYEEYAENCYGYCAPLEVIISVRESPMWTGIPYPRPTHHPSSWSYGYNGVPPAFWTASHWQNPVLSGPFAQSQSGSSPYSRTAKARQYREPFEETAGQDCILALADDAFFPEEIEKKVTKINPRSDKPSHGSGEELQRKALSSSDSASCYSTANSEDVLCKEENRNTSLERDFNENRSNMAPVKKENTSSNIKRMDIQKKETNIDLLDLPSNSIATEKCIILNGRVCKDNIRKQGILPNGSQSVSSYLTVEHLQNNWTRSPPPQPSATSFALKNNLFRTVQPTAPSPNNFISTPSLSPSPSQSRKRTSRSLDEGNVFSQHKEAKFSLKNQHTNAERGFVENKGNMSLTPESSVNPKSTGGNVYFSPPWPGVVASPESAEASFTSPLAYSNVVKQNRQTEIGQKSRSLSLSSDGAKQLVGASAQYNPPMYSPGPLPVTQPDQPVVTYPSGQFQTPPSPRDVWSIPSPCNHFRRSFDRIDRWKTAFINRSKSYSHTFIDTHCHIDFLYSRINSPVVPFKDFMADHVDSFPANYEGCVSVFCHPKTFTNYRRDGNDILNVVSKEKGIWIAAGCHPKNAVDFKNEHMEGLLRILKECPNVVALGEIGLDYSGKFYMHKEVQKNVFRRQLVVAVHLNLPLVIHCRDADLDCLQILQEIVPRHHKIHAHCFTRDLAMAHKWMALFPNLYLGLTPVITYKSAHETIQTAAGIPLERLLLETDAPYFVPAGAHLCHSTDKYSHPGMALYTAETVAMLKSIPVDKVLKAARENTHIVYGI